MCRSMLGMRFPLEPSHYERERRAQVSGELVAAGLARESGRRRIDLGRVGAPRRKGRLEVEPSRPGHVHRDVNDALGGRDVEACALLRTIEPDLRDRYIQGII